jgi:signal transduction histidine kinase/ActR/RegA family two-component response regulator
MILVVDDRKENLLPLRKILERHDFTVDTAESGEEALKKSLQNEYSLIILDVQMPEMDGFEVAEALRGYSKTKHIPIIFLSAVKVEKKFISKGYESGGMDYVTKPIDNDIFLLKVRNLYQLSLQTKMLMETKRHLETEIGIREGTEIKLQETLNELKTVLESLPQLSFTANARGELEYVNSRWMDYSVSKNKFPEFDPDQVNEIYDKWVAAIKNGHPVHFEARLKRQIDQTFRWHLFRAVPVKEDERIVRWVGSFTDIEDQKRVEKRKDEFLSIASHELKTPLTSLKAYFQLIERLVDEKFPSNMHNYVHKTHEQIEKLNLLISDLLDISRIQNGKIVLSTEEFNFHDLVMDAVETVAEVHPGYTVECDCPDKVMVTADRGRLEQVILNYLTNAVKYSPNEKRLSISIKVDKENKSLRFEVTDYGIGIPKEKQPYIFDKFFRVEDNSIRFQGMGIGLFISAEIIRRHHGTYGVESEVNKGSTFYFTIPLSQNIK